MVEVTPLVKKQSLSPIYKNIKEGYEDIKLSEIFKSTMKNKLQGGFSNGSKGNNEVYTNISTDEKFHCNRLYRPHL